MRYTLSVASRALRVLLSVGVVRSNERQVPRVVRSEPSLVPWTTRAKRGNFCLIVCFQLTSGYTFSSDCFRQVVLQQEKSSRVFRCDHDINSIYAVVLNDYLEILFLIYFWDTIYESYPVNHTSYISKVLLISNFRHLVKSIGKQFDSRRKPVEFDSFGISNDLTKLVIGKYKSIEDQ